MPRDTPVDTKAILDIFRSTATGRGCTLPELDALEVKLGQRLPAFYRSIMSDGAELLYNTRIFFPLKRVQSVLDVIDHEFSHSAMCGTVNPKLKASPGVVFGWPDYDVRWWDEEAGYYCFLVGECDDPPVHPLFVFDGDTPTAPVADKLSLFTAEVLREYLNL